jgi:hypothetical protein
MRFRRFIAAVLLPPTFSLVTGCYTNQRIPPDELRPETPLRFAEPVKGVVTPGGYEVLFDEPVEPQADTLHATVNGEPYVVALDQVDTVIVKREFPSPSITGGLVIFGIIAGVAFFAALIALKEGWKSSAVPCC